MSDTITFSPEKRKRNADILVRLAAAASKGDWRAIADIQEEAVMIGTPIFEKAKINSNNITDEEVAEWAFSANLNKMVVDVGVMALTESEFMDMKMLIAKRAGIIIN